MIDERLYADLKASAAKRGESVSHMVCEAIRVYMANERKPRGPLNLPVGTGTWIAPLEIFESNVKMLDYIEEDLPLEKIR